MSWKPVEPSNYFKYSCPKCRNTISSILGEKAQYVVCRECNKLFQNTAGNLQFVAQFKKVFTPVFSVGATGKFNDKKFQLIGILEVKEDRTAYYWREYIIKYEDETIAYFMEYDGHWSYVEQIYDTIVVDKSQDITYNKETYTYFNTYKTVNVGAIGDFFWNIINTEKPRIREYINPPYGLVGEYKKTATNWYKTEYIKPSKIESIFDGASSYGLPMRTGVYSTQPLPVSIKRNTLIEIGFFYLLFMTIAIALTTYLNDEHVVFNMKQDLNQTYSVATNSIDTTTIGSRDSVNTKPIQRSEIMDHGIYYPDSNVFVSEPFKVSSQFNSTALDVQLSAPVSNNWFEVSCQMINENTGQEYFFEIGVEYYFGPGWTEGSTENNITLSQIPDGTYRMVIKPYVGHEGGMQLPEYRLTVIQGTILWSNFFILLIGVLALPIGLIVYINNFNASRWYNSNLTENV